MTYPFLHTWDPNRYARAYLRMGLSEAQVQELVLATLQTMGVLAWPVDAGARMLRGRAVGALRRAGVRHPEGWLAGKTGAGQKGLADITGVLRGGRALFIEMKAPALLVPSEARPGRLVVERPAGEATMAQLAFLEAARRQGAVVGIAWAASDLKQILGGPQP